MREILFRGKTTDKDEWVEGFYTAEDYNIFDHKVDFDPRIQISGKCVSVAVDPQTVGQFTGLYDKNGTKIFEGDIVELGITYEISYIKKYARFAGRNSGCIFSSLPFDRVRVIGNIHDNPELLEG